ncbi:hypothetical protein GCM10017674_69280 [Streptomyces gardneri]|uniref:Uncharacterized protein n=1 Tax=Streptomyces gardneri TaxID=66892 RepID=A0A4Y3RMZ2_9ACTN|nr:hypothetical protein SGA01_37180 [Streptomyces gardneri]GHH17875.1 hypothetical protein GCM10017674_69280 [Streptomyces gardneri]
MTPSRSSARLSRQVPHPTTPPRDHTRTGGDPRPRTDGAHRDRARESERGHEPGDHRQRQKPVKPRADRVEDPLQHPVEDQRQDEQHKTRDAETKKPAHVRHLPRALRLPLFKDGFTEQHMCSLPDSGSLYALLMPSARVRELGYEGGEAHG